MRKYTITGTITNLSPMNNSRMGNPRWSVSIVDVDDMPHVFGTQPDAACAYGLDNPEFRGGAPVEFTIERGQITYAELVTCQWFAGCTAYATGTRAHPAFPGGVPVCELHSTWEG